MTLSSEFTDYTTSMTTYSDLLRGGWARGVQGVMVGENV